MNGLSGTDRLSSKWLALWTCDALGLFLLAAVTFGLFWVPLTSGLMMWGPDSGAHGVAVWRTVLPEAFSGQWSHMRALGRPSGPMFLNPYVLLALVVPPMRVQVAVYMAGVIGLGLATAYFLHGRGVRKWALWGGAIAMAFSPHSLTIVSAGHMGKIEMMPFAVLLLAEVDRAVTRRSMFHFAMAGVAAAFGFTCQMDVMVLFGLLAIVYGAAIVIRERAGRGSGRASSISWRRYLGVMAAGVLLAMLFFSAVSAGTLKQFFGVIMPTRTGQAEATRQGQSKEENKWEFVTNWSLPPQEIAEFILPCIYGTQSGDPDAPYWGKLGRTLGWEETRQGLRNLRQHTVYLGAVSVVLAIVAVWAVLLPLSRRGPPGGAVRNLRFDILFWGSVLLATVLLALGRNFPLYRLFYQLPGVSTMRAPVKFLHLSEVSLSFLAAFALVILFGPHKSDAGAGHAAAPGTAAESSFARTLARRFAIACGVVAILCLGGIGLVHALRGALFATWRDWGFAGLERRLMEVMISSLSHAAVVFFLLGGLLFLASLPQRYRVVRAVAPVALLVLIAIDLAIIDSKYINVWKDRRFDSNALIDRIRQEDPVARTSVPTTQQFYGSWRTYAFPYNRVCVLDPLKAEDLTDRARRMFEALSDNPLRLWQLSSVRSVVAPVKSLQSLVGHPAFAERAYFDVQGDGSIVWMPRNQGRHLWLHFSAGLPRAAVYHSWVRMEDETSLPRLADMAWNPMGQIVVAEDPGIPSGTPGRSDAVIKRLDGNKVVVECEAVRAGVLMLTDAHDPDWRVKVDGKPVPLLRCNYAMRGVALEPGPHRVEFSYHPDRVLFLVSLFHLLVMGVWAGWRALSGMRAQKALC